jgi:hypothetical protein
VDFYHKKVEKVLAVEESIVSGDLEIGGTMDLVCVIDGETWLIDHKTSNGVYRSHHLQVSAYGNLWVSERKTPIDRYGILHLKALTRKDGDYQGQGWKLIEVDADCFAEFQQLQQMWKVANPDPSPFVKQYPERVKL